MQGSGDKSTPLSRGSETEATFSLLPTACFCQMNLRVFTTAPRPPLSSVFPVDFEELHQFFARFEVNRPNTNANKTASKTYLN